MRLARSCTLAALVFFAACSAEPADEPSAAPETNEPPPVEPDPETIPDDRAWPIPDWQHVDPDDAGFDPDALAAIAAAAEEGGSTCLVVTRAGEVVGEWYWDGADPDTRREAFSVTKSITSTLVGIAQDRGLLDLDDRASDYIEAWQGTPSEDVTIRNLVANDSGRFQDAETDYVTLALQAEDKTGFAIDLEQQHEPGEVWVYNNAAIQTLDAVLEEATGMPTHEFAEEVLFAPLGMASEIGTDPAGNTLTFMGAQATCRDLARFGLLFLREGEWAGEQVVSAEWVEEATSPSTELNDAYGYLWWLNQPGTIVRAVGDPVEGQFVPGGPDDLYAALGLYNQVVAVFPSSDVVVTRMGADAGEGGASFGIGQVATQVPAALEE